MCSARCVGLVVVHVWLVDCLVCSLVWLFGVCVCFVLRGGCVVCWVCGWLEVVVAGGVSADAIFRTVVGFGLLCYNWSLGFLSVATGWCC